MSASITWCGHATFRLELPDGRVLMIDPWLTGNPACPKELQNPARCDLIVLTHGHADHVGDVPRLVERFDPVVVGNFDLCAALEQQVGKGRFSGMNTGGTQVVDGVRVSLTQAFHSSALGTPQGPAYAGMPNGAVVAAEGVATVYHAGDTDVFGDMKLIRQLLAPRVCLLPIGDYFTMGAAGAALATEMLDPEVVIPCHYRTFPILAQTADKFRAALPEALKSRLVVAEVGRSLAWTATGVG